MGYSNFKHIRTVSKTFDLDVEWKSLFSNIPDVNASDWLKATLSKAKKMPLTNEKTKAERIISPILFEVFESYSDKVSFFSGEALNVDAEQNLSGECDFFFALHPPKPFIDAPIIALTEAKDEEMGTGQCAAQMYGAWLFNKQENKPINTIYGCATDGTEWHFLKLENNTFTLHNEIITNINELLGIWHYILQFYTKTED
jgi:hypothetical protein